MSAQSANSMTKSLGMKECISTRECTEVPPAQRYHMHYKQPWGVQTMQYVTELQYPNNQCRWPEES